MQVTSQMFLCTLCIVQMPKLSRIFPTRCVSITTAFTRMKNVSACYGAVRLGEMCENYAGAADVIPRWVNVYNITLFFYIKFLSCPSIFTFVHFSFSYPGSLVVLIAFWPLNRAGILFLLLSQLFPSRYS